MGSIGPAEVIVVLIVGLIVLGPNRLPEAARQIGKAVAEFRKITSGLQAEVRDAFTEPVPGTPPVPPAPTSPAVAEQASNVPVAEQASNVPVAEQASNVPVAEQASNVPVAEQAASTMTEIGARPSPGPEPWVNPAVPVDGPPPASEAAPASTPPAPPTPPTPSAESGGPVAPTNGRVADPEPGGTGTPE